MQPATRVTAVDSAIQQMRSQIANGFWPVGSRIPAEQELTRTLGISRAPLREATRALVHAGLLVSRQGDGTYVVATDESAVALHRRLRRTEVIDILEVRRGLDVSAVRLASLRRRKSDLAEIEAHLAERRVATANRDQEVFARADAEFHMAIAAASHNTLLVDLYRGIFTAIQVSVDCEQSLAFAAESEVDDHEALFDAIKSRDATRATQIALQIIDEQEQTLPVPASPSGD